MTEEEKKRNKEINLTKNPTEPDKIERESSSNSNNGFDVVKWIYDFILSKEPVACRYLEKYNKKFDLSIKHKYLFWVFLTLALIIDTFFAIFIQLFIVVVIFFIVISLARGLGLDVWFIEILKNF